MTNTTDTWQARMFREHDELCGRIGKLRAFITSPEFSDIAEVDRGDLHEQLEVMTRYAQILARRCGRAVA